MNPNIGRQITFWEVLLTTLGVAVLLGIGMLLLGGCASFSTTQTDKSYDTNGSPQREITTKAKAWTFWAAKSSLATWKATQTDKTQGATVGGLVQEGNTTNINGLVSAVVEGAVKGAASFMGVPPVR